MATDLEGREAADDRVVFRLLACLERNSGQSQRRLAVELGIALGLVNTYLKRCIKKGLLKVSEAPARRYAYYLTPKGFAEKSRLTIQYMSYSFSFFRQAKASCAEIFEAKGAPRPRRVVLAGVSDLAEIATICALERGVQIVAVVDATSRLATFVGQPVVASYDAVKGEFDVVVVTDLHQTEEAFLCAVKRYGCEQVLVPALIASSRLKQLATEAK